MNKTYTVLNASRCILPVEIFNCRSFVAYEKQNLSEFCIRNCFVYTIPYMYMYMKNWSLDDFLLQLSQRIIHVVLTCMYHIFLNTKKNCIINRKLFVNFPPNCLWKTCCFSSISFIQDSFILKRLSMIKNAKLSEMIKLIAGFYTDN